MDNAQSDIEIIREDHRVLTAIWSDAVFMFWFGTVDDELLDRVEVDLTIIRKKLTRDYVAMIVIVKSERTPPLPKARSRLAAIIKRSPPHEVASATVLETQGFQATISRGVITELDVKTQRQGHRVFDHIVKASAWLTECLGRDRNWGNELAERITTRRNMLEVT